MKKTLFVLFFLTIAIIPIFAQIAGWDFNATTSAALNPTTGNVANVSSISFGSGLTGLNNQVPGSGCGQSYTSTGYTTAFTNNDYWEFTLTPTSPAVVNVTNISFAARASSNINSYAIRYSVDNFASDLANATPGVFSCGSPISVPISMADQTTAITFRIYFWGGTGTTSGNTLRIDDLSINGSALPIEFKLFSSKTLDNSIKLSFSTATEKNNDHFAIERSNDGRTFTQIGEVKGAGTSLTQQDYTYTDEKPLRGINFYRLKQVDFDGQFTYSPVVSVVFGKVGNVVLYPTPTTSTMNVRLEEAFQTEANWQVIDLVGRVVTEGIFPAEQTDMQIPVGTLSEGNYVLRVTAGQEVITQKFRKIEQ